MNISIRKIIALLTCFVMSTSLYGNVYAYAGDEGKANCCDSQKWVFSDGTIQIINYNEYVLVSADKLVNVDEAVSLNVQNEIFSEKHVENREQVSAAYFPLDNWSSSDIYNDLIETINADPRGVQLGTKEISGSDYVHCATFTLRVNYTKETKSDNYVYYDMVSVEGGFEDGSNRTNNYVGENVYVTNLSMDIIQGGSTFSGEYKWDTQRGYDISLPLEREWRYDVNSSWQPVTDAGLGTTVGAKYYFTLTRGNSSWTNSVYVFLINTNNVDFT